MASWSVFTNTAKGADRHDGFPMYPHCNVMTVQIVVQSAAGTAWLQSALKMPDHVMI